MDHRDPKFHFYKIWAIFYNTKINQVIPEGLYVAVAQVLAYVFQLQEFRKGNANKPSKVSDLEIPDELKR